ncbi:hypothetical protein ACB092_07G120900 [Castanea dentata]
MAMAKRRMKANFELINNLGVDWWCFHDRDIAPNGKTLEESNANLDEVVAHAKDFQTAEEYEHRRENFFNELEIVFADVELSHRFGDYYLPLGSHIHLA